jgi:hypothetical protein
VGGHFARGTLSWWLRREARRLIDRDQPTVLVEDRQGRRGHRRGGQHLVLRDDVQHVGEVELAREDAAGLAVEPQPAFGDQRTNPPPGDSRERGEALVETLPSHFRVDDVPHDPRPRRGGRS